MSDDSSSQRELSLRIGRERIDIERRWEVFSILNDVLTGTLFLTGSLVNLLTELENWPLVFYLLGSSTLLLRAFLRLGRRIHITRHDERARPQIQRPSRHDQP